MSSFFQQCHQERAGKSEGRFPLTPALSLGERENVLRRRNRPGRLSILPRWIRYSLSLRERVRVRGKEAILSPSLQQRANAYLVRAATCHD